MQQALVSLPIFIPIVFWAGYHYHKDRHLPEPVAHLLAAFCLGMLAAGLSRLGYLALEPVGLRFDAGDLAESDPVGLLAYTILAIGPIEELAKALPFILVVIRFRELNEPLDGFIYASFIALGYAAVENWQYLDYLTQREALARGFVGPVVHILFASIWGYWICQAHLRCRSVMRATAVGVTIAAMLHGFYDFLVLLRPRNALPLAALMVVGIWLWRLKLMRDMHSDAVANSPAGKKSGTNRIELS
jgi:RsiW-degrading membrane proteinase PrsW (M82 family)